ncbi:fimbrial protein [Cupriavidus pauculus]|nr:fimbrial protein [Cupriavidus pauculus]
MVSKMKNLRTLILGASVLLVAASPQAFASDGTITFNGRVSGQTCTIAGNGGGSSFTVTLPTVPTSALSASGNVAGRTPFNIVVSGCNPATGNVSVFFEPGATVDYVTGRLVNTEAGGAGNVEVGLQNANLTDIALGSGYPAQNSQVVALACGGAPCPITPSMWPPAGQPRQAMS